MDDLEFLQIYPYARRVAAARANQFVAMRLCADDEREDICQQLLFHLWRRLPKFNGEKSSPRTFATLVISRKATSVVSARICLKRDVRRCQRSLDEPADQTINDGRDAENVDPLWATLAAADSSSMYECIRRIDVQRVVGKLPWDLSRIARALATNDNRSQAALAAKVSLATLYRKIPVIRRIFLEAGLQAYADVTIHESQERKIDGRKSGDV
jgi:DNA-directed RNA polymerase specialized sigma24 family protein